MFINGWSLGGLLIRASGILLLLSLSLSLIIIIIFTGMYTNIQYICRLAIEELHQD